MTTMNELSSALYNFREAYGEKDSFQGKIERISDDIVFAREHLQELETRLREWHEKGTAARKLLCSLGVDLNE